MSGGVATSINHMQLLPLRIHGGCWPTYHRQQHKGAAWQSDHQDDLPASSHSCRVIINLILPCNCSRTCVLFLSAHPAMVNCMLFSMDIMLSS
jgi:hypothetical protein